MEKLQKNTKKGHMFRSLKKDDGSYSIISYVRRAMELVGPMELKRYFDTITPEAGTMTRIRRSLDYYGSLIKYGATVSDYFEYEFWKKKDCVRRQYITKLYSRKIQKHFNVGSIRILSDKLVFNESFADYRNLLTFNFNKTVEQFIEFVQDCDRNIIAKPITGFSGNGIFRPDVSTDEKTKEVYERLKASNDYFCEEAFIQDGILHEIHPYSVNTIRYYTLNDKRKVHLLFAAIRFGGSEEPIDNIHAGGMSCEVDLESGIVIGKGYNLKGDCFVRHPMSKKMIIGTQVPNWERVKNLVEDAAKKCPEIGYIGWDIAVSNEKVCLLEGNECANVDVSQTCGQRGLRPLYDQFMNKG